MPQRTMCQGPGPRKSTRATTAKGRLDPRVSDATGCHDLPAPAEGVVGFNNHTLRMNPRISIGGDRLRVRISNAYGNRPLPIRAERERAVAA